MSHVSVGINGGSVSNKTKPGFISVGEVKVGDTIECYVDAHNGDDEDGQTVRNLQVVSIEEKQQYIWLFFNGPTADEPECIHKSDFVKVIK